MKELKVERLQFQLCLYGHKAYLKILLMLLWQNAGKVLIHLIDDFDILLVYRFVLQMYVHGYPIRQMSF